ncbi:phage minor capsid protein [Corynebacterium variabile]|uniref:phage minor capsid protein n=1 Tax=Corynebacterium variabile TaxID=1727 RepID=UPI002896C810|nr:phage minor capsid protein [Corynebacterium variabile]
MNPQDVEGLEDETVTLWSQAEDALIGALSAAALAVSVRARSPEHARQVAAEELARTIRPQSVAVARVLQQNTPALVEAAVSEAAGIGAAAAHTEVAALPAAPTVPPAAVAPKPTMVLPETRPQIPGSAAARGAASKAADATTTSLGKAARSIPRNTQTVWGKIIDNAVNKTVTGDLTIQQALQQAMDDAAKAGLGFYRDSAGRKWGLDTYSEMAIRTGTNNALIDAHTAELVEVGMDLVIVSSHANPAPQCAPYERRVLSLTGEHRAGTHRIDGHTITVKDTLNGARAQGFEHPNCRHTVTAYLPGFTDTTPPTADPNHEGYKATQKQRYYEREIRKSRRMEQAAIDDDGRKNAEARRRQYEKKLREHIREHDLPRRRHREKLRQPGNPMPVA